MATDNRFFTGSQKTARRSEKLLDSDSESDVLTCFHRHADVIPWSDDSEDVEAFRLASDCVMAGDWRGVVQVLLDIRRVVQMMAPMDASGAAGNGLIHTMFMKDTPDWLTDHVLHRTPMEILCHTYNAQTMSQADRRDPPSVRFS